jgi:hypothetical protein
MSISLYDASVVSFLQVLGGVAGFLEKSKAYFKDNGADPDGVLETRLFDDMWPFRFQLVAVAHHSKGALEGARAGVFRPPNLSGADLGFTGLQGLIADAQAALEALSPSEVNALEGKDLVFEIGSRQMPFAVEDFLLSFSTPNLHFHATTAYDILRSKGVPLGKRDYMGRMRLKV